MTPERIWTRSFVTICLSSFFVFLNFYLLATTLPGYVADVLHGGSEEMGLVITLYVLAAVVMRPMAGQWVDRYGKKVAVAALAVFFACSVCYSVVHGLLLLLVIRAIHGGSYGVASTTTGALAADLVPDSRKGEGIGYFSMFMSLAMVVGPFLGLTLVHHASYETLFVVCAALTAFAVLFGIGTKTAPRSETNGSRKGFSLKISDIIEPKALPVSLAGFVLAFSYSSLTSFISVYADEIGLAKAASYFFVCFAVMIVVPRPIVGKLFDRYGEHVLAYPGVALFVAGMLLLGEAHSVGALLAAGAVIGLGHGALIPCFQTLALRSAPGGRSGLATGTFFLLFDLGYGIGSFALGLLAERFGYAPMYRCAALLVVGTGVVYYLLHHRRAGARLARQESA